MASCCRAQAPGCLVQQLQHWGCSWQAPGRRLRRCGARAKLPRGAWNLPPPGTGPVSSGLAGQSLTTGPPGQFAEVIFEVEVITEVISEKG